MRTVDVVRAYFDREATRFDAIYEGRGPLHHRIVDNLFRRVVLDRFRLITNLAPTSSAWTALDVGCGSGRYAVALAEAGASRVKGVDVAGSMIALARQGAMRPHAGDLCEFVQTGFLDLAEDELFDVIVAAGYFDYVDNPVAHLRKMVRMCRGRIFASIPKRWEIWAPLRKIRFAVRRAFVRFYSRREVLGIIAQAGLPPDRVSLIDLGRDWVAVIRVN